MLKSAHRKTRKKKKKREDDVEKELEFHSAVATPVQLASAEVVGSVSAADRYCKFVSLRSDSPLLSPTQLRLESTEETFVASELADLPSFQVTHRVDDESLQSISADNAKLLEALDSVSHDLSMLFQSDSSVSEHFDDSQLIPDSAIPFESSHDVNTVADVSYSMVTEPEEATAGSTSVTRSSMVLRSSTTSRKTTKQGGNPTFCNVCPPDSAAIRSTSTGVDTETTTTSTGSQSELELDRHGLSLIEAATDVRIALLGERLVLVPCGTVLHLGGGDVDDALACAFRNEMHEAKQVLVGIAESHAAADAGLEIGS